MNVEERIAQFEKMCREDPDNDMGHFSLAGAYNQAGRFEEAASSYARCIALNEGMSKAFQLAGASYMACGRLDEAREILTKGYVVAAERGDLMPKKAIGELLEQIGAPVPEVANAAAAPVVPDGSFVCSRTGRPGTPLDRAPFRGPIGEWIGANISKETWNEWIGQGTKVINELRLDLSRDEDSEVYDQHMREFLGLDEQTVASLSAS